MNDEIKEIERILATSGKYITYAERCYVLDYITNLQQENERLKNEPLTNKLGRIDSVVANIYRNNKEKEDYKSRCEKAIELLKYYDPEPWSTYQITGETLFNLLNILQGENNGN